MTPEQKQFLQLATVAARKAGHIFPEMAASEAALESSYGRSALATEDKNLFGMKQHRHAVYGTHVLPTKEFEKGEWIVVGAAKWVSYPDWGSCFADRMATLNRLAPYLQHYRAALSAIDPLTYVVQVSESWSTDPAWQCSCRATFLTEAEAKYHLLLAHPHLELPIGQQPIITVIPGLGRALKVQDIYQKYMADGVSASAVDGKSSV